MNIPCNISPLGWKSLLPAGYTRLEFLEGTQTQYIKTGVLGSGNLTTRLTVLSRKWDGWNNTNRVFGAVEEPLAYEYSMNFNNGWGLVGLYSYGTQSTHPNKHNYLDTKYEFVFDKNKITRNGEVIKQREGGEWLYESFEFTTHDIWLWRSNRTHDHPTSKVIYHFSIDKDGKALLNYIPALDPTGTPCMYDTVSRKPFYNSGSGSFVAGVDTVAHLSTLLKRLPATGGALTLSLPAEANTPEVAEALQQCHDAKGWTLTVHEYRPAAAVTYSLRRMREIVWCRKQAAEYGWYVDSAGNRWQVERCAAIFGPFGQDPTAYCYTPFDSVEQAVEFWELAPYVAPEEQTVSTAEL